MKQLVNFPLEDGSTIIVEVDEPETGGTTRAGRFPQIVEAQQTLEKTLQRILPTTKALIEQLKKLEVQPDEIEVAFGIKLSATAGAIIASAATEANFDVTLHWKRKDDGTPS